MNFIRLYNRTKAIEKQRDEEFARIEAEQNLTPEALQARIEAENDVAGVRGDSNEGNSTAPGCIDRGPEIQEGAR